MEPKILERWGENILDSCSHKDNVLSAINWIEDVIYSAPSKGWNCSPVLNNHQISERSDEIWDMVDFFGPHITTSFIMDLMRTAMRYHRELQEMTVLFDSLVRQEVVRNLTMAETQVVKIGSSCAFLYNCPKCGASLGKEVDTMSMKHKVTVASATSTVRYPKIKV